ncbi:TPA: hypothetical protein QCJ86_001960 [Enterobacter asburiae]|nr:hypothetical protein [Enterobacter asburiae]
MLSKTFLCAQVAKDSAKLRENKRLTALVLRRPAREGGVERKKKAHSKVGKKYWKQCEQCRTEYLSVLLNYSVLRKIIFLNKRCNPAFIVCLPEEMLSLVLWLACKEGFTHQNAIRDAHHKFPFSHPVLSFSVSLI